jgi:hypothetical protein
MTFWLSTNVQINLPSGRLNIPPFRDYPPDCSPTTKAFSMERLITTFSNNWTPITGIRDKAMDADQPTNQLTQMSSLPAAKSFLPYAVFTITLVNTVTMQYPGKWMVLLMSNQS